jgi:membrane-bound ClpP family serine protease
MDWMIVAALIFFGIVLVIAEIIFVPGTTIVGVIGAIFMVAGVVSSFSYFGSQGGWITLGGTAFGSAIIVYYAFKANVWGKFSLKTANSGKVNEGELEGVIVGQEGLAISALRPSGKAEIENKTYEVKTLGAFVDAGSKLKIIKVNSNQIIVEPIQ